MKKLNLLGNGFIRREDLDFTDDGARFTAYEYDGIIITKCTHNREYFISIRIDYLRGYNFIYEDYCDKEWYKLCDEFNGVLEVDIDKLKRNIITIKNEIELLEKEIENDPINNALLENRLLEEEKEIEEFLDKYKMVDLTKYDDYIIRNLSRYFIGLKDEIKRIEQKLINKNYTRYEYKKLQKYGYLIFKNMFDNYYTTSIMKILK